MPTLPRAPLKLTIEGGVAFPVRPDLSRAGLDPLHFAGRDYYLEWSTVVDAPVSPPMSLEEFTAYYQDRYGAAGAERLPLRMERVHATGTSERGVDDVADTVRFNRAGLDESCLPVEHIVPVALARMGDVYPHPMMGGLRCMGARRG